MSGPEVTDFTFAARTGIAVIMIERKPEQSMQSAREQYPRPEDVPPDIREALLSWLQDQPP